MVKEVGVQRSGDSTKAEVEGVKEGEGRRGGRREGEGHGEEGGRRRVKGRVEEGGGGFMLDFLFFGPFIGRFRR